MGRKKYGCNHTPNECPSKLSLLHTKTIRVALLVVDSKPTVVVIFIRYSDVRCQTHHVFNMRSQAVHQNVRTTRSSTTSCDTHECFSVFECCETFEYGHDKYTCTITIVRMNMFIIIYNLVVVSHTYFTHMQYHLFHRVETISLLIDN